MQYYNSSQPDNTLWCNQSGKLVFNSIQSVHIRIINLLECFGSKVIDVRNFTLLNTTFTGSYYVTSGSALEIIRSTALMYDCLFTKINTIMELTDGLLPVYLTIISLCIRPRCGLEEL